MKRLLLIVSTPAYRGSRLSEAIEAALVGAVFDFEVSVLFVEAGVSALRTDQNADEYGVKTISRMLNSLSTYDIERVYACSDSLAGHQIDTDALSFSVAALDESGQADIIAEQDIVLSV